MTREECLLKLLAVEPESRLHLALVTGWPPGESDQVLDQLIAEGRVHATYVRGERRFCAQPMPKPSRKYHHVVRR